MQYNWLIGTGIQVSELCLGTSPFGGETSKEEARRIVDMALEAGINYVDTADMYRDTMSETTVGEALKGRRNNVILATKLYYHIPGFGLNDQGLSRYHILSGLEGSLKRLQTDHIDLLYMHQPDYHTPIDETLEAMTSLVRAGKVRYFGASNHAAWQFGDLIFEAARRGLIAPAFTQVGYNLLARGLEQEFVPFAQKHGIGIIVYQALAAGLLTGKHSRTGPAAGSRLDFDKQHHARYWNDRNLDTVDKYALLAKESGLTLSELALKWCTSRPFVCSTLVGIRTPEQLAQNLKAADGNPLPCDVLRRCEEIYQQHVGLQFNYCR